MDVLFLGVGEACDPNEPNTSILVKDTNKKHVILLDCGFTTPHQYFAQCHDPEELQGIWISHFHGDHYFGLPLLLLRMAEMGRKGILPIYGPEGISSKVCNVLEMAYPNCKEQFSFDLECVTMSPGQSIEVEGLVLSTASVIHSQNAMAIRIDGSSKKLFYSGDGRPTASSLELARGCDLIVHESFSISENVPGHCSVKQVVEFAQEAKCKGLAIVHINHQLRKNYIDEIEKQLRKLNGLVEYCIPGTEQSLFL